MEATFRDINLPVQSQPLFILSHFQIAGQTRFQAEGAQTDVVTNVNRQVAVDGNTGALLLNRLQIFIQHHFVRRDPNGTFRHIVDDDTRPRNINAAIKAKQARGSGKDHIRRNVQPYHRRHGNTNPAAFGRHLRAPVVNLGPVGVTAQTDLALFGIHGALQR